MKKFKISISLSILIICFIGSLINDFIPLKFQYSFGFFVGTICNVVNTAIILKKYRE